MGFYGLEIFRSDDKSGSKCSKFLCYNSSSDFGHNNNRRDFFIGSFACYFYILHCSG